MKIAKWVRAQRLARGWTRGELARRIKVESGGVGRWERGECLPRLDQFRRMCVIFECSADEALRIPRGPSSLPIGDADAAAERNEALSA